MSVWVSALRMLAMRRLSEAQLRERLFRKGYAEKEVELAIERARQEKFLDDHLYAELFVAGARTVVGDRRLIAEMVKRGISHETAAQAVVNAQYPEIERLAQAVARFRRSRPTISLPSLARALERQGFPTASIYRYLRSEGEQLFQRAPPLPENELEDGFLGF